MPELNVRIRDGTGQSTCRSGQMSEDMSNTYQYISEPKADHMSQLRTHSKTCSILMSNACARTQTRIDAATNVRTWCQCACLSGYACHDSLSIHAPCLLPKSPLRVGIPRSKIILLAKERAPAGKEMRPYFNQKRKAKE